MLNDDYKITAEKQQRDFDDLQNELVGREVGRIARFLGRDEDRSPEARRRKRAKEVEQRHLLELLTDPLYHETYDRLSEGLSHAESSADQTIQRYEAAIQAAAVRIAEMESSAARGPDGQLIFRDASGRVVDAEGRQVAPEIAAGITWPEHAPSAEEYFAATERLTTLQDGLRQWLGYRTNTLGRIRDRFQNEDDPMTLEEMQDALEQIEAEQPPNISIETQASAEVGLSSAPKAFPTLN